ncbi:DUF6356 family protein [uncultured Brevundimonas sp.]|uniref:DUF6356 family protein n=1 Tax=uncultured Brevundimonas sp. TaxID=213418 RepID=UPI0030EDC620|tara:strand:- start:20217 stop:20483 length:267 start_codon:yes stop_codon:yes gene_type:complete
MIRTLKRLFVDHPREVGEGYFEHMAAAARFGLRLLGLAGTAFLHAVVPGLCKTTVSKAVCAMADEVDGRAKEARDGRMREAGAWDPGL